MTSFCCQLLPASHRDLLSPAGIFQLWVLPWPVASRAVPDALGRTGCSGEEGGQRCPGSRHLLEAQRHLEFYLLAAGTRSMYTVLRLKLLGVTYWEVLI